MSQLPDITYEPLDEDAMKHAMKLFKSQLCARPVLLGGVQQHISCMVSGQSGGRIEVLVYLAGDPKPHGANEIEIGQVPT